MEIMQSIVGGLNPVDVVITRDRDVLKEIISCSTWMEELSLSFCDGLELRQENMYELHKLRLRVVKVDTLFFTDFASRFPCLKDLAIEYCYGVENMNIQITSTSLETIGFEQSQRARFDVPNIRKFAYVGIGLPSLLSIEGGSKEWEFDVTIVCYGIQKSWWFEKLRKLLTEFRHSRMGASTLKT